MGRYPRIHQSAQSNGVAVIVLVDGEVLFLRCIECGTDQRGVLSVPSGDAFKGETAIDAGQRIIAEQAGLIVDERYIEPIGSVRDMSIPGHGEAEALFAHMTKSHIAFRSELVQSSSCFPIWLPLKNVERNLKMHSANKPMTQTTLAFMYDHLT